MVNQFQLLLLSIFSLGFIGDVFFLSKTSDWGSDIRLAALTIFWLIIGRLNKFHSTATFKLTLVFLILLAFLFTFFQTHPSVERVATWVYIYLFIGIVQQFWEVRKES